MVTPERSGGVVEDIQLLKVIQKYRVLFGYQYTHSSSLCVPVTRMCRDYTNQRQLLPGYVSSGIAPPNGEQRTDYRTT